MPLLMIITIIYLVLILTYILIILDVPQWLTEFQGVLERWSAVLFMENISRKQREAIKNRKLSLLEFRCYLFSRQASLLMAASKPWKVCLIY